jgi:hypothetical protein
MHKKSLVAQSVTCWEVGEGEVPCNRISLPFVRKDCRRANY